MLASASLLIATRLRAPEQPAICCTAPETATVMYRSGVMVTPVSPTWSDGATQPASVAARLAATAAPSGSASSCAKFHLFGLHDPRPPETTTLASLRRG